MTYDQYCTDPEFGGMHHEDESPPVEEKVDNRPSWKKLDFTDRWGRPVSHPDRIEEATRIPLEVYSRVLISRDAALAKVEELECTVRGLREDVQRLLNIIANMTVNHSPF